ncbi:unnamed protein product [Mycena citricolor]|uniref:assimilatory sulfite reductase (NADPH) n=1 Tax=Mycena citricolor TaxID=2018698 RepID=A0AAD2K3Y7_9AGAR|nr:unnamed protein product [Mycena citricolor]
MLDPGLLAFCSIVVTQIARLADQSEDNDIFRNALELHQPTVYRYALELSSVLRSVLRRQKSKAQLLDVNAQAWSALFEVGLQVESGGSSSTLKEIEINTIAVQTEAGDVLAPVTDSFEQNPVLRPELPERTFLVTYTVNRRVKAKDYDRNVFHLGFDTSGTRLKYVIGEALGVHGWNDESKVLDFCALYGVNPRRLVTIPVLGREDEMHTRTVFQALQQQIDLFGRPSKSFFTDLAAYATNYVDQHALLFTGAPEGAATFKELSETDTVTFADVLGMYPSARTGIQRLCELVRDIKPWHYSIASAQSVVGDRVDLLVVTLEWANPSGSPRYGQRTRYLARHKLGQKVTVSIKLSVMKVRPLIMAGLDTGAAPFRAFLQHRAMLQKQGEAVGPVYYYFGSRYQSQEYLYSKEIEVFVLDNVITHAGLAFSRDGLKKVCIQHKMLEDSKALADVMLDQQGMSYLCRPMWPVPDVYEALVDALVTYKGKTAEAAGE